MTELLDISARVRESLTKYIDRDIADLTPDATDADREDIWLRAAFWPILGRVLDEHEVPRGVQNDLAWMLACLTRMEASQGWDRGYEAGRKHAEK